MKATSGEFQRARRPEQVEARRAAILSTAEAMLAERLIADISLRELSDRVGLAKSNVLRYFDSREAIFLEVLNRRWSAWLDELEPRLREAVAEPVPYGRAIAVATAVAHSVLRHPLLCELFSAMASVLERNISVDFARVFKAHSTTNTHRLARLVRAELPHLGADAATHFAEAVLVITAGLWPHAHPTDAVARVTAELGLPPAEQTFPAALTESLVNQLIGLTARSG
ncbi:TetR/AcrR family transcriptional regulator [Saccharothrix coeruleofusca]|uniref:TetR family transcriptional regulator n=1 Tax=Saccharothrix coeruleofusca TaxID=33919 RepID=A0A918ATR5_9PSEU|nr:TetR family transcriptional regulator [Saccharothrix coeruleofusca]MBP2336832.1 AcrR family transcriptional regulator [Saccharothrix coeruleofusca]GGP82885.1 TetR family transcriptional regulator [Saccharothrix coeruleofusca]